MLLQLAEQIWVRQLLLSQEQVANELRQIDESQTLKLRRITPYRNQFGDVRPYHRGLTAKSIARPTADFLRPDQEFDITLRSCNRAGG